MANDRRGDRRPGGRPGGGGGQGDFRPYRSGRPPRRGPEEPFVERDRMPRPTGRPSFTGHPPQRGGYAPRPAADDGGMTVRVDPRRLGLLKQLAAEAGVRPGELVQAWVEQRLDAERAGGGAPIAPSSSAADSTGALAALASRLDDLVRRIAAIEGARATQAAQPAPSSAPTSFDAQTAPRKRGRPRKVEATAAAAGSVRGASPRRRRAAATLRIALHDEIIAAIRERGP